MAEIQLGGHTLQLLAEKAVWCEAAAALFVADVHLGKTATFRREGIPLPEGGTEADLDRLGELVERYQPRQLTVLGDLVHARQGVEGHVTESFSRWRERFASLELLLIRGNHDRRLRDWPERWRLQIQAEPFLCQGLELRHYPTDDETATPWLAGHLHPSVRVRLSGRESFTAPAFHRHVNGLTLPAFGSFTGTARGKPGAGGSVYAVVGESVLEIPPRFCRA